MHTRHLVVESCYFVITQYSHAAQTGLHTGWLIRSMGHQTSCKPLNVNVECLHRLNTCVPYCRRGCPAAHVPGRCFPRLHKHPHDTQAVSCMEQVSCFDMTHCQWLQRGLLTSCNSVALLPQTWCVGTAQLACIWGVVCHAWDSFQLCCCLRHRASCRLQRVQLQGLDRVVLAQQLVSSTTLDKAQADALVAGLTREMCLIQGPPGTGIWTRYNCPAKYWCL